MQWRGLSVDNCGGDMSSDIEGQRYRTLLTATVPFSISRALSGEVRCFLMPWLIKEGQLRGDLLRFHGICDFLTAGNHWFGLCIEPL